ncbi:SGNH/GDSL hydrolase family protein [Lentisphaera profundi]|uniref:SGNH/GDSL hydrolase family protein n=1 Tax=Lentisphaera profundi TaxID=1658616 RepID=A0ABY7VZV4_9BACT|nr:SGNH/GDSL hydrolase family protein [Lentisphaera profundi]WDE99334.1 SGNH/GDSL hydrolase family protein [Lentisphaera profundi]
MKKISLILSILAFSLSHLYAQPAKKTPFTHPFVNPVDQAGIPRVLIIGDSISIGYTPRVRGLLDGKANVHRPTTNCRWSAFGDQEIEKWLGDSKWDLVHFNFGLWDWYGWAQKVKSTPESYAASLDSIIGKIKKKSKAKLVFAMTTPPCIGPEGKVKFVVSEERAKSFNDAARAVMKKHGVQINDLYQVIAKERAKYQRGENNVHYTDEGRDLLAAQVVKVINQNFTNK